VLKGQASIFAIAGLAMLLTVSLLLATKGTIGSIAIADEMERLERAGQAGTVLGWQHHEAVRSAALDAFATISGTPKEKLPLTGEGSFAGIMESMLRASIPKQLAAVESDWTRLDTAPFAKAAVTLGNGSIVIKASYAVQAERSHVTVRKDETAVLIPYNAQRLLRLAEEMSKTREEGAVVFEGAKFTVSAAPHNDTHNIVAIVDETLWWKGKPLRYVFFREK
jgi:hypothetical protein